MNNWQVAINEGVGERDASIARAFWELAHEWTKIKFVHTTKEVMALFGISGAHALRKIQMAACTVQAPDTSCRQCHVGLRWRAKSFASRALFQEYVSNWMASLCDNCRKANAAQRQAEQKEWERIREAEAAQHKALLREHYADRALGDCPNCEGVLVIRKSQTNGGVFVGCSSFPDCSTNTEIEHG